MRQVLLLLGLLGLWTVPVKATPLPVEQAFRLEVSRGENGLIDLEWTIASGYYLYRDHIRAKSASGEELRVETEAGVAKDDPSFGVLEVYYAEASARLRSQGSDPFEIVYQGCQEDGICYRPERRIIDPATLQVSNPESLGATPSSFEVAANQTARPEGAATSPASFKLAEEESLVSRLHAEGGSLWVIASFLVFGLLLSFTPCVFPMYPILAGALARQGEQLTSGRGFMLSAIYVVSLAAAFGVIGAIAGWSGQNLQMVLQSPLTTGAVAAIFILLALSMFGLFELQLPASWTTSIAKRTGGMSGSKRTVAVLGFTSALIVGPCVTAPLAGALLYIAQTADIALGAAALFAMGIGKGIPLIVIGTIGGQALPRAGAWMESVKHVFGFGFIAAAIFMATPLLPAGADLVLWSGLLISIGTYAFNARHEGSNTIVAKRAIGTMSLAYGVILMLGAASGATDPFKPLANLAKAGVGDAAPQLSFVEASSVSSLRSELSAAEGSKPTLVYFTADWCISCHTIERSVLTDHDIRRGLDGFHLVKADLSDISEAHTGLMDQLRVAGPPTMLFFDSSGAEPAGTRLVGSITADNLAYSASLVRGN